MGNFIQDNDPVVLVMTTEELLELDAFISADLNRALDIWSKFEAIAYQGSSDVCYEEIMMKMQAEIGDDALTQIRELLEVIEGDLATLAKFRQQIYKAKAEEGALSVLEYESTTEILDNLKTMLFILDLNYGTQS